MSDQSQPFPGESLWADGTLLLSALGDIEQETEGALRLALAISGATEFEFDTAGSIVSLPPLEQPFPGGGMWADGTLLLSAAGEIEVAIDGSLRIGIRLMGGTANLEFETTSALAVLVTPPAVTGGLRIGPGGSRTVTKQTWN